MASSLVLPIQTSTIDYVKFGLMSPEEVLKISTVEITSPETLSGGRPISGGVFDLRMGTIDKNEICTTCKQNYQNCPGHPGYVRLASPVFHPQYMSEIKKVLEVVCFNCNKILIEPNIKNKIANLSIQSRLSEVKKNTKNNKKCNYCDFIQPSIDNPKNTMTLTYSFKKVPGADDNHDHKLTPSIAKNILSKISNEDATLIGFSKTNRPEWMIITNLLISPPSMRPTVSTDNGEKAEDNITVYLVQIMRLNNQLKEKIQKDEKDDIITTYIEHLNIIISGMIEGGGKKGANSTAINALRATQSGKVLTGLASSLGGKSGHIRRLGMGKRVDYSARSVISPDPNINLDVLGVPIKVAKIITYPEIVNSFNKEKLYSYIYNNKLNKYPMAISIEQNGRIRIIKHIANLDEIVLKIGDTVRRQMVDDDVVLFNRQPTLHKMSMMAFKTKIMQGDTFRINLSVTTPYNADQLVTNRGLQNGYAITVGGHL